MTFEAFGLKTHAREASLDLGISRLTGGIICPLPVDRGCARFFDQLRDHIYGRAAAQNQLVSLVFQSLLQGSNTLLQPPFRRGSQGLNLRIADEHSNHRATAGQRRRQRRVVLQTQVAPEPQ